MLGDIGFIKRTNDSKGGAPYFAHPKKNSTVRFFDFINLNRKTKHKTYPMPKPQKKYLLNLEEFK